MPKQTRLSENAQIYQQRKEQTEKEKLKEMPFKKKAAYLWEYYKLHALAAIIVIATVTYMVKEIVTPNIEPQLYAAFINNTIDETVLEEYEQKFSELLMINPEREEVVINPQFYLSGDSNYAMDMRQVLSTYVAAQEVDIIIAPKSEFETFSYYGYMYSLSDLLPTDLYSSLSDYFYIGLQEDNTEEKVYGIYMNETELFKNYSKATEEDPYILGVIGNTTHLENSIEFIQFLFR